MIDTHRKVDLAGYGKNGGEPNYTKTRYSKNYMLFRKLFRRMVTSTTYYSGATLLFDRRQRARILVYHSISEDPLNPFSVSPEDFERQVRFLSREYNVISLEELIACIKDRGRRMPLGSVVITLDDGFRDNYTYAYPILKRYNTPATIFVIVERLAVSSTRDGKRYLSWDQVSEMSENGISFGSHTLTHPWLTQVPLKQARHEIFESKARLEQQLGKPVHLFAYPGGRACDFNQQIKEIVIESGYSGACSGLNGTNGHNTDPYLLRRTKIEVDDGMYVFKKAIKGSLDILVLLDQARRFS